MDEENKLQSLDDGLDEEALRRREMRRRILLAVIVVLCIVVAVGLVYGAVTQAPAPGEVTVTIEVRYSPTANPFAYFVHVPAGASLKDALLETGMVSGEDGEDGFSLRVVGDISVNPERGESWRVTCHEEPLSSPLEDVRIEEDMHFELIFTEAGS